MDDSQKPSPAAPIVEYAPRVDPTHVRERRLLVGMGGLILLCAGGMTAAAAWFAYTVVQTEPAFGPGVLHRIIAVSGQSIVIAALLALWGLGALAPRRWASAVATAGAVIIGLVACDELVKVLLENWSRRGVVTLAQWVITPAYACVVLTVAAAMAWLFVRGRCMDVIQSLDRAPRWSDGLPLPVASGAIVALAMASQSVVQAGMLLTQTAWWGSTGDARALLIGRLLIVLCFSAGAAQICRDMLRGWNWLLAAFLAEAALAFVALARFEITRSIGSVNVRQLALEQQMLTYAVLRAALLLAITALLRRRYAAAAVVPTASPILDGDDVPSAPVTPRTR